MEYTNYTIIVPLFVEHVLAGAVHVPEQEGVLSQLGVGGGPEIQPKHPSPKLTVQVAPETQEVML